MHKYASVNEFLASLTEEQKSQVQLIRSIILEQHPALREHIKWNAPSYVLSGTDRLTFNTNNKDGKVKLVFHMDTKRKENKNSKPIITASSQIIEWVSDIRGYVTFDNVADVTTKKTELVELITKWLDTDC